MSKTESNSPFNANAFGSNVKDSAQQIWLAGLGAFAKAQEEGGKVFETLVQQGLGMQRKTQSTAEEKIAEATSRMSAMANDIGAKATGQWDKLENIFEERVAKALAKLGVPTLRDLEALNARVDALTQRLTKLEAKSEEKSLKTPASRASTASKKVAIPKTSTATKTATKTAKAAASKAKRPSKAKASTL